MYASVDARALNKEKGIDKVHLPGMSALEPDQCFILVLFLSPPNRAPSVLKHPNVQTEFTHHFPPVTIFRTLSKKLGIDAAAGGGADGDARGETAEEEYGPSARPSNWFRMSKMVLSAACSLSVSSGWKKSMMRT